MANITKFVLKRPVTVCMILLCILVFGVSSIFGAKLEQMPETDQPMLMINASYSGAGPEDIDELVTSVIEDNVSTLEGVKSISSTSSDGRATVRLEYDYDQDMDDAYNTLSRTLDSLSRRLPDGCTTSVMMMGQNASTTLSLSITSLTGEDLYDYVDQEIVPLLEQLSTVAQVETRGGSSEYIKVELKSDMMKQYNVTLDLITQAINAADLTYPSGDIQYGNLDLSVTTSLSTDTLDDLLNVPITTQKGKTVYLEDVADVYYTERQMGGASRYNGIETISVSITKNQDATAMACSSDVKGVVNNILAENPDIEIEIVNDESETIMSSLEDVAFTMVLAVIIAMVIIFLFFGDIKASLIVGSSIPTSILVALILLTSTGNSLNVITMSAITLGVGMMVDNSIVVLESCFRAIATLDENKRGFVEYARAAYSGTSQVIQSIMGSTLTTCVVFIPLIFLTGMAGQMFGALGYTLVFSMCASFLSAISIVPLTYLYYRPKEKSTALLSNPIKLLQNAYRKIVPVLLRHRVIVMGISVLLVIGTVYLGSGMEMELMTQDRTGQISVSVTTRPGLIDDVANDIMDEVEELISTDEHVESYMMRYQGSSGNITAYVYDDVTTAQMDDLVDEWQREFSNIPNCTIEVSTSGSMSFMGRSRGYSVILLGSDYDELKEVSDEIVAEMTERDDVYNVHSSLENTAPVVTIKVDQVAASAEGLTATQIGSQVKQLLDTTELTTLIVDGQEISVIAEYPEDEYQTISELEEAIISTNSGSYVALADVAAIEFRDNPSSISKSDKKYQITISAEYSAGNVSDAINEEVVYPNLPSSISIGENSQDQMMNEEFSSLFEAIALAVFLVFVVLSAQFESPRFAIMVMTTIPFSLIGAFGFLQITGVSISMTSLVGFLILVGTVVNNGILFVDTVNRNRLTMDLQTAIIEAGTTRLRPILMTTLTTTLAMTPMALAFGSSGATTQALAIVNIGGLLFGALVALFILPVYYSVINGRKEIRNLDLDDTPVTSDGESETTETAEITSENAYTGDQEDTENIETEKTDETDDNTRSDE